MAPGRLIAAAFENGEAAPDGALFHFGSTTQHEKPAAQEGDRGLFNGPLHPTCRRARNAAMRVPGKIAPLVAMLALTPASAGPLQDGATALIKGDYATALQLLRPLAEQGNAEAQFNLGVMYVRGQGVSQDYVLGHMWFNLATSRGNKDAAQARDIAALHMTPAQIAEAQRLAREWKPTK
jgi:TPR repeat protein